MDNRKNDSPIYGSFKHSGQSEIYHHELETCPISNRQHGGRRTLQSVPRHYGERLIPLGTTDFLWAIKRLVLLEMINIEKVPRKQGDPAYKKSYHRYFFIKDRLKWSHTINFRMKLELEIEQIDEKSQIFFRTDLFFDEKHLEKAFNKWLLSIKAVGFDEKPQAPAVSPNSESKKRERTGIGRSVQRNR